MRVFSSSSMESQHVSLTLSLLYLSCKVKTCTCDGFINTTNDTEFSVCTALFASGGSWRMPVTVNAFYLFSFLHILKKSITIDSVYFDGFLKLQLLKSLSKLKVFLFLSGTLFVIGMSFE